MSESSAAASSDRVTQAAEMVAVQVHCSPAEALLLIEARANETGRDIEEIAMEIVEREIRFDA